MKKAELYILIFGIILCATAYSPQTWDATLSVRHIIWAVITLILFVSITARAVKDPKEVDLSILKRWIFPVFAGYLVLSIVSIFQAINVSEGLYQCLRVFTMLIYLFCATIILRDKRALITAMTLLTIGLGLYGCYEFFVLKVTYPVMRVGTMSGKNLWAAAFLLLLPFCIYCYRHWKIVSIVAVLLALFNIFTISTRSVLLALFISSIAVSLRNWRWIVVSLALMVFSGMLLYFYKGDKLLDTKSITERKQIWGMTVNLCADNPWGIGAGNWRLKVPEYAQSIKVPMKDDVFLTRFWQYSHSDFLQSLSETGIIGMGFYLMIFGTALFYAWWFNNRMVFFGICSYIIFACFDFPGSRTFHSMILMIFLALAMMGYHKPEKHKISRQSIYIGSLAICSVLLLAIVDFSLRYKAEYHCLRMLSFRDQKIYPAVIGEMEHQTWFSQIDPTSTPYKWYAGEAHWLMGENRLALWCYYQANQQFPSHVKTLLNLGTCYSRFGADREALKHYEKILTICPNYQRAQYNLEIVEKRLNVGKNQKTSMQASGSQLHGHR